MMNKFEKQKNDARAKILKALAHPSRLFMVEKLYEKPHCVCELSAMIGSDASTTSKHLSILKNAGIVDERKVGTTVYSMPMSLSRALKQAAPAWLIKNKAILKNIFIKLLCVHIDKLRYDNYILLVFSPITF